MIELENISEARFWSVSEGGPFQIGLTEGQRLNVRIRLNERLKRINPLGTGIALFPILILPNVSKLLEPHL